MCILIYFYKNNFQRIIKNQKNPNPWVYSDGTVSVSFADGVEAYKGSHPV